jgi:hypothetical protein
MRRDAPPSPPPSARMRRHRLHRRLVRILRRPQLWAQPILQLTQPSPRNPHHQSLHPPHHPRAQPALRAPPIRHGLRILHVLIVSAVGNHAHDTCNPWRKGSAGESTWMTTAVLSTIFTFWRLRIRRAVRRRRVARWLGAGLRGGGAGAVGTGGGRRCVGGVGGCEYAAEV